MRNLYREQAARTGDDPAPPGPYSYVAAVARDRRKEPWRWLLLFAMLLGPGALVSFVMEGVGAAIRGVLASIASLALFFALRWGVFRTVSPIMKRREKASFAARKLAADTEAFLQQQEDADMKTRVFLRPATPGAPPEELATEPPPSEKKLTAA